jgi:hypothetical protein
MQGLRSLRRATRPSASCAARRPAATSAACSASAPWAAAWPRAWPRARPWTPSAGSSSWRRPPWCTSPSYFTCCLFASDPRTRPYASAQHRPSPFSWRKMLLQDARSEPTAGTAQRAVQIKIAELQAKARAAVAAHAALVKARMVNPEVRHFCQPRCCAQRSGWRRGEHWFQWYQSHTSWQCVDQVSSCGRQVERHDSHAGGTFDLLQVLRAPLLSTAGTGRCRHHAQRVGRCSCDGGNGDGGDHWGICRGAEAADAPEAIHSRSLP